LVVSCGSKDASCSIYLREREREREGGTNKLRKLELLYREDEGWRQLHNDSIVCVCVCVL